MPCKLLPHICNTFKLTNCPIVDGIVPKKHKTNLIKILRVLAVLSLPCKLFPLKSTCVNLLSPPKFEGIVPITVKYIYKLYI